MDNTFLHSPPTALPDLISIQYNSGEEWQEPMTFANTFTKLDDSGHSSFLNRSYIDFLWDAYDSLTKSSYRDINVHQIVGEERVGQRDRECHGVVPDLEGQRLTEGQFLNFDENLFGCSEDAGNLAELFLNNPLGC